MAGGRRVRGQPWPHTLGAGRLHGQGQDTPLAQWACGLFEQALAPVQAFTSPRAWAFALLGLSYYCAARPRTARRTGSSWSWRAGSALLACESKDWVWFEDRLTYDNARLCEALIVTGKACGSRDLVDAGLRSLRWLLARQTAPEGHFRPVGRKAFADFARNPALF
jgi:hypothetical protein